MNHLSIKPWSAALALSLLACGSAESYGPSDDAPVADGESSPTVGAIEQEGTSPALRAAFLAAAQADAPRAYDAAPDALGFSATNPGRGFMTLFRASGVEVQPNHTGEAYRLSLHTTQVGCAEAPHALGSAQPSSTDNRVDYRRAAGEGEVTEWYVNGPLGLEQGFTLEKPLSCGDVATDADGQDLVVTLDVGGDLLPALAADGRSIELLGPDGAVVLRYSDLYVHDAHGAEVPATLALEGNQITLRVEDEGAAYPLTIDPLVATEIAQLIHGDPAASDNFGALVDMDGDLAVFGVPGKTNGTGAAYVFYRNAGVWAQEAKLTASDGVTTDNFGSAVAISGDTVVVGAQFKDFGAVQSAGAAYFFVRSGNTWSQQQKVTATVPATSSSFGSSVAIDGNTAAFATLESAAFGGAAAAGYIFVRTGSVWSLEQKVTPSNAITIGSFSAAAVEGDTAIFSWRGTKVAYAFTRTAGVWTQQKKFQSVNPALSDDFGSSVALRGDTAFIGARTDSTHGVNAGAVYVWDRAGSTWTNTDILFGTGIGGLSYFGGDVKVSNDTLVIGAQGDGAAAAQYGAAWVYVQSGGVWSEQLKLLASDPTSNGWLGAGVAVSGGTAICGANGIDTYGANAGKAYVFDVPTVIAGSCGAIPPGMACDDGDPCTFGDTCNAGVCAGTPEADGDADGVCDPVDNCPSDPNPSQLDLDNNGYGEACLSACISVPTNYGATDDASIDSASPTLNFNNPALLIGPTRSSLVRFDLSVLPPQTVVSSAELAVTDFYSLGGATVSIHAITAPWVETGVTYNNFANAFNPVAAGSFTSSVGKKTLSVTGLVQSWLNGSVANNGIVFRQPSGETRLRSSEYAGPTSDLGPRVLICYTAPGY